MMLRGLEIIGTIGEKTYQIPNAMNFVNEHIEALVGRCSQRLQQANAEETSVSYT